MSWPRVFVNVVFLSLGAALTWFFLARFPGPRAATSDKRAIPQSPGVSKSAEGPPATEAQKAFEKWSADPALAGASVGFCLLDEEGGIRFASPLAWNALCPASALKTVTTAAALELLGPDSRFHTLLYGSGKVSPAGVLGGDLLLSGLADPTLSTTDLEELADKLVKAGVRTVNGRLHVRGTDYGAPVNDHWNWGDIGNAYGAGAYGLNLDHNRFVVSFKPAGREGEPAVLLGSETPTLDTRWINEVRTGPAGSGDQVVAYSEPYGRTIKLVGTVPLGVDEFSVRVALPDPPARVEEVFRDKLKAAGVEILGNNVPEHATVNILANHRSAPLPEIIDHLHKVSDNLEAQCLFFTIGGDGDPALAVRKHWESRGVGFVGLRLIDGSGLARANMIRPLDLAKVNHLARHGPHGERFRQSLTAYLDGRVRSKLGAMSGVKTDVGFITMADGREFTFCLMANGLNPELNFWPLREKLLLAVSSADPK